MFYPDVKLSSYCVIAFIILFLHPVNAQVNGSPKVAIQVELTTHLGNQPYFVAGDTYHLLVKLNQSAYLRLYYQNNAGPLLQIYPLSPLESGFHGPGYFFPLTSKKNTMTFKVTLPLGTEKFWLFACDKPLPLFKHRREPQGFLLMSDPFVVLQQRIKRFAQNQCVKWGETYLHIETRL